MRSGRMINRVVSVAHPGTNPFKYLFLPEHLFFSLRYQVPFALDQPFSLWLGDCLSD